MESVKENVKLNSTCKKQEEKLLLSENTFEQTESLSEVTSVAEQTEDTELSLTEVSAITVRTSDVTGTCDLDEKHENFGTVEKEQPQPLYALLPVSKVRSQDLSEVSLKTATAHSRPPDDTDACAALLLACLFCRPLDCLLATVRGCNVCVCWFCSSLCGCEATVLQPLLNMSPHCGLCGCLGARCCLCDCPLCDICLQATECLDLAMEISQMLYH